MESRVPVKDGFLLVKEYKKGLEIISFHGEAIHLEIPGFVEALGRPIISVGKKAFLSNKLIRSVAMPDTIEEISDWAFAYCDELREVFIPYKHISFGRGIFQECSKLRAVYIKEAHQDIGGLMAAAATLLDASYLFDPVQAGDAAWIKQWDTRMLQILHLDDHDGYSKMLLCGEEDYGSKENNLDYFLNQKRKGKVRIAFMRLLNPIGMDEQVKKELIEYLRTHTKGQSSEETWEVLHTEHGDDREYYKLFTDINCLDEVNFDMVLADIKDGYPEMKAFFLKYKEEKIGYSDFFGGLLLD